MSVPVGNSTHDLKDSPNPLLSGLLQATDTGHFLTCDLSHCWFTSDQNSALTFARQTGHDGQYEFVVQGGQYNGRCLDREHCHSSTSNARLSDCNHCGSYHWQQDDQNKLGEDHLANCIQNDGSIRHCSDSFQPIAFYQPPRPFGPPTGKWNAAGGVVSGSLERSLTWGTTSSDTHARTTTWAQSLSTSFDAGAIFEGTTITATVSHSIANMMSSTFTQSVSQSCEVSCAPDPTKPFIFLYQWYTDSVHVGDSASHITRATSCNYMCIYQEHGEPLVPQCALTCCYDATCQTCRSDCATSNAEQKKLGMDAF